MDKIVSFFKDKYNIGLILVMVIYTILSFIDLGTTNSPKSFLKLNKDDYIILETNGEDIPAKIVFFNGYAEDHISFFFADELSDDNSSFVYDSSIETDYGESFKWQYKDFNAEKKSPKYIMISSCMDNITIGELALVNDQNDYMEVSLVNGYGYEALDEQQTIWFTQDRMHNAYFDEIYFPRAAYEIFNNKYVFEYVHPTLGKIIMWIPMALFGISPFTFRLMGNIAGILMILVMYLIGNALFKDKKYGLFLAIIMALDGMHFVQTRVATVDCFLVLFSLLSFLFFIKYLNASDKKSYLMLILSGLFWGCTISVKWSGAFVGLGLGIIFFIDYFKNKKLFIKKKFNYKPILMGFISFVLVPVIVYILCHIPIFLNTSDCASYHYIDKNGKRVEEIVKPNSIRGFLLYEYSMYQYHSELGNDSEPDNEHPATCGWYSWPLMIKPMWYYNFDNDNGTRSTIACMGNPAIWWFSLFTFVTTCLYAFKKKHKEGIILIIMVLCTLLPYAVITREMYIYHYFIVLPYMMCTIAYAVKLNIDYDKKYWKIIPVLSVVFLVVFIIFYPIYSGLGVPNEYIEFTKWLPTWSY